MSSSVLKKCGLIRRPSPRKSVQTSRASSSWQIFSASGPTLTLTTPPRASRSRGVRTSRPASSARAIRWSVSSPCRARIAAGPTSEMMSIPPCAMKKTGAGGVPCSSRRARGVIVEMLGVERERLSLREPAGDRRLERGKEVAPRVQEHRAPDRRASISGRRPCRGRTRGRGGRAGRSRDRGSRRRRRARRARARSRTPPSRRRSRSIGRAPGSPSRARSARRSPGRTPRSGSSARRRCATTGSPRPSSAPTRATRGRRSGSRAPTGSRSAARPRGRGTTRSSTARSRCSS